MNLLVPEILDLVEKTKNKADKVQVLRQNETPGVRGILRLNFDTNVKFDLPEGEPPYKKDKDRPIGYQPANLITEVKRFYIWVDPKQNISRLRKEQLFVEMCEGLHYTEAEVLCLAKDRKLKERYKSLNEDLVREAFPGLIPPKPET
jgi:hypothetical protein